MFGHILFDLIHRYVVLLKHVFNFLTSFDLGFVQLHLGPAPDVHFAVTGSLDGQVDCVLVIRNHLALNAIAHEEHNQTRALVGL